MNETYKDKVKEWKSKYGKIFSTIIGGEEFIYRILNVGESQRVYELMENNQTTAEDFILQVVLYPFDFNPDNYSHGVIDKLVKQIIDSNKIFDATNFSKIIEEVRTELESTFKTDIFQWKMLLISIFPGYSLSDLDKMNIRDFFKLLVLAEKVTGKNLINYEQLEKNEAESKEKLSNIDTSNVTDKFMSQRDLEQISADTATQNLKEHWKRYKK